MLNAIVPVSRPPRPVLRALRNRIEDVTFTSAAECMFCRDTAERIEWRLAQEPVPVDEILCEVRSLYPRLQAIGDSARALTGLAERLVPPRGQPPREAA